MFMKIKSSYTEALSPDGHFPERILQEYSCQTWFCVRDGCFQLCLVDKHSLSDTHTSSSLSSLAALS